MVSSELLDAGCFPAANRSMGCPDPHEDGSVRGCERGQYKALTAEDVHDGGLGEVVRAGRCGRGRRWWWRRLGGRRWRWSVVVAVRWSVVGGGGGSVVGGGGGSVVGGGGSVVGGGGFGGRWWRFGGRRRRFVGSRGRWRWWWFGGRRRRFVGCRGRWRRVRTGLRCRCGGRGGRRRWFSGRRRCWRRALRRCGSLRGRWRWGRLGAAVRRRVGTRLRCRCGGGSGGGGLCVSALGAAAGGRDQRGDAQHGDAQQQEGGNGAAPVVAMVPWFADGHNSPSPSRSMAGGGVRASTVPACRIRGRRRCPARPPCRSRRSCLRRTHRPA